MARYSHKGHDTIRYDMISHKVSRYDTIRYNTIRKCFTVCKNRARTAASRQQCTTLEHRRSAYQHSHRCRCLDTGRRARRRSGGFFEVFEGHSAELLETLHSCYCLVATRPAGGRMAQIFSDCAITKYLSRVRLPSQSTHRPTR